MVHRFVLWNLNLNYYKSSLSKEEREHYKTLKHFASCICSAIAMIDRWFLEPEQVG